MVKIELLLIASMVIIIGFISGCTSDTEYTTSETISADNLKIINHSMSYGEYGNVIVEGTTQNIGEKRMTYAAINVKFYDENDNLLTTGLDNINDLDSGETWKFEVYYLGMDGSEVDRYTIGVGTVW